MPTRKQERFAHEYLIDQNGAQAAIRAGYSSHTAGEQAYELLRHPEIAELIEKLMAERSIRTGMQQDMVLYELAHLGFSNVTHYAVDQDTGDLVLREGAPVGSMAAVQSVRHRKRVHAEADGSMVVTYDSEVKLWDKPKALFLLGRHVGLFADRIEHVGKDGGPIESVTRIERVILPALESGALALKPHTEPGATSPALEGVKQEG